LAIEERRPVADQVDPRRRKIRNQDGAGGIHGRRSLSDLSQWCRQRIRARVAPVRQLYRGPAPSTSSNSLDSVSIQ
jgi:hypothetical protein